MPLVLLFNLVIVASALASVLVGLVLMKWLAGRSPTGERRITLPMVGLSVLAVAALGVIKLPAFAVLGLGLFSLLRVIFVEVAVGLPLGGLLVLLAGGARLPVLGRTRATWAARLAGLGLMAPAPLGAYAVLVEPNQLVLEEAQVPVPRLEAGASAIRVAVLADLQFRHLTDHERDAVALAMAQKPDIILLPGDLYSGPLSDYRAQRDEILALFNGLSAPGGVYLVEGDHEPNGVLDDIAGHTGLRWLNNEIETVSIRGARVDIGGVELNYDSPSARQTLQQLANSDADVRVALAHRPDVVYAAPANSRIDLFVAGHTHGGQVQLPWLGPILTLSRVPRASAGGGLSDVRGQLLYVSRGIGMERGWAPPVRFLCRPEVSLLHLTASD